MTSKEQKQAYAKLIQITLDLEQVQTDIDDNGKSKMGDQLEDALSLIHNVRLNLAKNLHS